MHNQGLWRFMLWDPSLHDSAFFLCNELSFFYQTAHFVRGQASMYRGQLKKAP